MPIDRRTQMKETLEEVATRQDPSTHPSVRPVVGQPGRLRVRVGGYRAVVETENFQGKEILNVSFIGPRGEAYKKKS